MNIQAGKSTVAARFLKITFAGVAAIGLIGGTSVVAFAYPKMHNQANLHCQPQHVAPGGSCTLVFTDHDKDGKARANENICFSVQDASTGTASGCSTTDNKGRANGTFTASSTACGSSTKNVKASILGQETTEGTSSDPNSSSATTTVQIECKPPPHAAVNGQAGTNTSSGSTSGSNKPAKSHSGLNAAASLAIDGTSNGLSSTMLGIGILAFIVVVSVAITGRVRLRRFRR